MSKTEELENKKAITMLETLLRKIKRGEVQAVLCGVWPGGTDGKYTFRLDMEEVENPRDSE